MEKFKKSLITDAGRKMLLGLGAGSSQLTYTKAVLYDQDLSSMEDDQIRALTTMSGEKLSTEIKQVKVKDNTVIAYAVFQNADLADDVVFRAVGWYAKSSVDSIERLLAISPSIGTQTLASGSPDHRSTAEIDINLAMAISNNVSVNVVVDQTGVVHNKDLQDAIEQVKIDLKADIEQAGKVKTISIDGGEKIQPVDTNVNLNLGLANFVNKSELTDSNSKFTKDIQGKLDEKADKTDVYGKNEVYNRTETYSKGEVDTKDSKNIKTIEGNRPDASGEAKLPNFQFATAFNPVTKAVTTATAKYNTYVLVTPEALSALAEKVNTAYDMAKNANDNMFLVRAFHKADETQAEAWCAEDPLHREAHILDD